MARDWFVKVMGSELGPMEPQDVGQMATEGRLGPNDYVRRGTSGEWKAALEVPGLFDHPRGNRPPSKATKVVSPPQAPPPPEASKPSRLKRAAYILGGIMVLALIGKIIGPSDEELARKKAEREQAKAAEASGRADKSAADRSDRAERDRVRDAEAAERKSETAARLAEQEKFGAGYSARVAARRAVLQNLKAPSTADFPWLSTSETHLGNGVWVVKGEVDAQNSFGAKLRHQWHVRLKWEGNHSWAIEQIEVIPR